MSGARPRDKHLRQAFCHLRFVATIAINQLGVELSFPVSGHFQLLDLTGGGRQITRIAAVAVAFAFGGTLSPLGSHKLGQFFAHDFFHHHLHGSTDVCTQLLMKGLLDDLVGG
jgi:hypothetical protein